MHTRFGETNFRNRPPDIREYDDVIRVIDCTKTQESQLRFQRMMDAMATPSVQNQKPRAVIR